MTSIESQNDPGQTVRARKGDSSELPGPALPEYEILDASEQNRIVGERLNRSEEKPQEEEYTLRQITDAIAQPLCVLAPNGAVLYSNHATLDYTGLTSEDLHAPNFRERMFHPDDLARTQQKRRRALETGVPFEFELRTLRKDGQYCWFLFRYKPFRDEQGRVLRCM